MRYLVFEAGGRAGLSAELFFINRVSKDNGDRLVMADMDGTYRLCPSPDGVSRVSEDEALSMIAQSSRRMNSHARANLRYLTWPRAIPWSQWNAGSTTSAA